MRHRGCRVIDVPTLFFASATVVFAACTGSTSGDTCGPGTHDQSGVCVVALQADSGAPPEDSSTAEQDGSLSEGAAETAPNGDAGDGAASVDAEDGLFDPSPCMVGGNVLVADGDQTDTVHPGPIAIGPEPADGGDAGGGTSWREHVLLAVDGNVGGVRFDTGQGWSVTFNLNDLDQSLGVGAYPGVLSIGGTAYGFHPGLDVSGNGVECHVVTGAFQILDYAAVSDTAPAGVAAVTRITATFEQHCDGFTGALRGCIHFGCFGNACY
jgi:hypothetical protein